MKIEIVYFCAMKKTNQSLVIKILKWTGISLASILGLMFILPLLFPGKIAEEVKLFANKKLQGDLNFTEANLSFFNHFPSLTVTLTDFSLNGSAPYANENLVKANEVAFGINVAKLVFDSEISIDKIFVSDADINVLVNENGQANYNVYVAEPSQQSTDGSETSLKLANIEIKNAKLHYHDLSTKMLIEATGFNYAGNGDLDQSVFDLYTKATIDSFDFTYDGELYLKNKQINANLITKVNTNSLAFVFEQNDLKINKLPIDFKGKFNFLSNGYDIDFNIQSIDSKLNDFFTALPPAFVTWLDKSKVQGSTDIIFSLKGKYIASESKNPDMHFNMKIRDGFVNYNKSKHSATNIFLNFDTKLPSLDTEKMEVTIDSVYLNVNEDYLKGIVKTQGMSTPKIDLLIDSQLDLAELNRAFGIPTIDVKGKLKAKVKSVGTLDQKNNIIPVTEGTFAWQNGYLKTDYYPNAIENIQVNTSISSKKGKLDDLKIKITPAQFTFEGKPIYVQANLENFNNLHYDIKAKGNLDLGKIYKVFSQKGLKVEGNIMADVSLKGTQNDAMNGQYSKLQNSGTLQIQNIQTVSEYLPKPFLIKDGTFTFNQDKMQFKAFSAQYGSSDFMMNGYMQNVIEFVLAKNAILRGKFKLHSDVLNINEFMSQTVSTSTPSDSVATVNSGVVLIPENVDLELIPTLQKVIFDDLNLTNLSGKLTLNKGQMKLQNGYFKVIDTRVKMDVVYAHQSAEKAFFDFKVNAENFDIKRAYNEIKMFREMASAAESAEGIVSMQYKVKGILNDQMMPIYPSLSGGGTISVKDVKMKGFKMFGAVSKQTGRDAVANPDLKDVNIHTKIKNNIITIDRFKFKVAGFRPRIEGTTSFDGKLNIKMRLGLPPFGLFGIPLKVTGTQDNPRVRLGKQTEDLEEVEYDGVVPTDSIPTVIPVEPAIITE